MTGGKIGSENLKYRILVLFCISSKSHFFTWPAFLFSDAGFAEKHSHLDYGHCEGDNLRNLCSEGFSPGLSEREMSPAGMRSLSTAAVPLPESNYGQSTFLLDNMSIRELHEAFRSTFGRETSVKDKQWLKRRIDLVWFAKPYRGREWF